MELRQLEYFLAVSDLKSFTKAAQQYFVSQPAISNAISNLEKELDVQLFVRSNREFSLTTEGQVFYNYIKLAMKDVNVALSQLDNIKTKTRNIFKLAVTTCMFEKIVPACTKFNERNPDVHLQLSECTSQNALYMLETNKVEAALSIGTEEKHFYKHTLLASPLVICYDRQFTEYSAKPLWKHLDNYLSVYFGDYSLKTKEEIIKALDIQQKNIIGQISNLKTLRPLLQYRNTAIIIPGFLTEDLSGFGTEKIDSAFACTFSLYWKKSHSLSDVGKGFFEFLKGYFHRQEI